MLKHNTKDFAPLMTEDDKKFLKYAHNLGLGIHAPGWHRVTGKKNEHDEPTGLFGQTVLGWHSDKFMSPEFHPLVLLYGQQNMSESATSFVQTADWYESQTETFKSELNELVAPCVRNPANIELITPGIKHSEGLEFLELQTQDIERIPLVLDSPGGIRGLHFNLYMTKFEGMSQKDSDKILNKIKSEIFLPENEFPWWWDDDYTLLLFDNSITVHRRLFQKQVDVSNRMLERIAYRFSGDYAGCRDWNGYLLPEFRSIKQKFIDQFISGHLD
jgi:alpha-ketoglutarate-dependent taurine dioxygenase